MSRYIDADALLEWIKAVWDLDSEWINEIKATAVIKQTISDIAHSPTADVVPMEFHERCMELEIQKRANMVEHKRGEWKICDAKPPTWWYECSVCGNAGNIKYNFCPNCGAEMCKILPKL